VIFVNSLIRDIFSYDFSQCTTTTHEKKNSVVALMMKNVNSCSSLCVEKKKNKEMSLFYVL